MLVGRSVVSRNGAAMCEKCVEIDSRIARYQRWQNSIKDEPFVRRIKELIDDLAHQKLELHPEASNRPEA